MEESTNGAPKGLRERLIYNDTCTINDDEKDEDEGKDGYQLKWMGKNYAKFLCSLAPHSVIKSDDDHNKKDENKNSGNILITGDNIEVLRHLRSSYNKKVDAIYIDPPYNTGKEDFVYEDEFDFTDEYLQEQLGATADDITKLKSLNGRSSHSAWLTFMYPRLLIAKDLLKDTGVIFISIDDNEQANLKLLCDEVFGEGNFIAECIRNSSPTQNIAKFISVMHDYTLVYCKDKEKNGGDWKVPKNNVQEFEQRATKLLKSGLTNAQIEAELRELVKYPRFYDFDHYTSCDKKGVFQLVSMGGVDKGNTTTILTHPVTKKKCSMPQGGWRYNNEAIKQMVKDNKIYYGEDENYVPRAKLYLQDYLMQIPKGATFFDTQADVRFLKSNKIPFDFPKPVEYIKYLISMVATQKDSLILDFFAGSGTTGEAVMRLNAEDGGKRQYILVQKAEAIKEDKEAFKAGYTTIDAITKARLERAASAIKKEDSLNVQSLDLGFKHYSAEMLAGDTIDEIKAFDITLDSDKLIKDDFITSAGGIHTLLNTYTLMDGFTLTDKIEPFMIAGYKAYKAASARQEYLYIMESGWGAENTRELLNLLGRGDLNIRAIVLYGYTTTFSAEKELRLGLSQALKDKDIDVVIQKRY